MVLFKKLVYILSVSLSLFHRSLVVEWFNWFCLCDFPWYDSFGSPVDVMDIRSTIAECVYWICCLGSVSFVGLT
jgi:hypothetical protein